MAEGSPEVAGLHGLSDRLHAHREMDLIDLCLSLEARMASGLT
jgi:hypothetical protein